MISDQDTPIYKPPKKTKKYPQKSEDSQRFPCGCCLAAVTVRSSSSLSPVDGQYRQVYIVTEVSKFVYPK